MNLPKRKHVVPLNIQAGIQLLNAKAPGWRNKIDLDTLDVSSNYKCILGQVYGSYEEGLDKLGLSYPTMFLGLSYPTMFGFSAGSVGLSAYKRLTEEWKLALSS